MRDVLHAYAAPYAYAPLRKCEWCEASAQRGMELCSPCEKVFLNGTTVPKGTAPEAECVFGLLRAAGVLW